MQENKKTILNWLKERREETVLYLLMEDFPWKDAIVRVKKDENFDYLYMPKCSGKGTILREHNLEYQGFFCHKDGRLYDCDPSLGLWLGDTTADMEIVSPASLRKRLEETVRGLVEKIIGNNRENIGITEEQKASIHFAPEIDPDQAWAKQELQEYYMETGSFEPPAFSCDYQPGRWEEDTLLSYILDPEGYAQAEAETFLAGQKGSMYLWFLKMDWFAKKLSEIEADPGHPLRLRRRMQTAVAESGAKFVLATLRINGREETFRLGASAFVNATNYLSAGQMPYAEWDRFRDFTGHRGSHIYPNEVVEIKFKGKTIYRIDGN